MDCGPPASLARAYAARKSRRAISVEKPLTRRAVYAYARGRARMRYGNPPANKDGLTRLDGKANTLQGAVDAPPGSKPVGDIPELRLEDRLQEQFDRALDDAIFDCGNAQGS